MKPIYTEIINTAIITLINKKCKTCSDNGFCLLKRYYLLLKQPGVKDYDRLKSCIFYKKLP